MVLGSTFGRHCNDRFFFIEQPGMNMIHNILQTCIRNPLSILRRHAAIVVAHDGIDRDLAFRFARDCLERVPKRVAIPTSFSLSRSFRVSFVSGRALKSSVQP